MNQEIYSKKNNPEILCNTFFNNYEYAIISYGVPCVYICIPENNYLYNLKDFLQYNFLNVHGGINFLGQLQIIDKNKFWIGWSYDHYNDAYCDIDGNISDGKQWTINELIADAKNAINQINLYLQTNIQKMYILCNRRLSTTYAAVQGGHALAQWILEHPNQYNPNTTLVYLNCRTDKKMEEMIEHNYNFSVFKEPDLNNTITAIACLGDKDLLFTRLKTL